MAKCARNFVEHCDIPVDEALRMCSLYPAKVIHKENESGIIAKGRKANMTVLSEGFDVLQTITAG